MLAGVLPANYAWLARDMIIAGLESAATTAAARAQAQPPDNERLGSRLLACVRACTPAFAPPDQRLHASGRRASCCDAGCCIVAPT
jgi:hypothetical protein